jgi:hypothetical protein
MKERDLTIDRSERCSCCGSVLLKEEKVFRCEDYATKPNVFPTAGYKYNGHQTVDFSKAVYCSNCVAKFEQIMSRIRLKMKK